MCAKRIQLKTNLIIKDFLKSQRQLVALSLQFFNVKHFLKNIKNKLT